MSASRALLRAGRLSASTPIHPAGGSRAFNSAPRGPGRQQVRTFADGKGQTPRPSTDPVGRNDGALKIWGPIAGIAVVAFFGYKAWSNPRKDRPGNVPIDKRDFGNDHIPTPDGPKVAPKKAHGSGNSEGLVRDGETTGGNYKGNRGEGGEGGKGVGGEDKKAAAKDLQITERRLPPGQMVGGEKDTTTEGQSQGRKGEDKYNRREKSD